MAILEEAANIPEIQYATLILCCPLLLKRISPPATVSPTEAKLFVEPCDSQTFRLIG